MQQLNRQYNYVKGTMDVWVYNYTSGDLEFYDNKITANQLQTSVNVGALNAGVGNPVVIQIPDTSAINLTITAQDFSLMARKMQTGGTLSYNAITPVNETIVASGTSLTVSNAPVAPYGLNKVIATIDGDGTAYEIDAESKIIQGFQATTGTSYCVRYFTKAASAECLRIGSVFVPEIKMVLIRMPAYTASASADLTGTVCGYYYIYIPRMQFSGKADTEGSQTTAATTDLTGSALSYDDAAQSGACVNSVDSALAYIVYMPVGTVTSQVQALVVPGGSVTVAKSGTVQIPVKYLMPDNKVYQPNYGEMTYASAAVGTATVNPMGVVTGVAVGDTEVEITLTGTDIKTVCNVTVTA